MENKLNVSVPFFCVCVRIFVERLYLNVDCVFGCVYMELTTAAATTTDLLHHTCLISHMSSLKLLT